jgi:hypothetical protein
VAASIVATTGVAIIGAAKAGVAIIGVVVDIGIAAAGGAMARGRAGAARPLVGFGSATKNSIAGGLFAYNSGKHPSSSANSPGPRAG